ncbi:MAG: hypothetical protein OXU23_08300 [Candidatus Poribacteria bacterium]|nr:hypothetical protein [Candidatus Poribacteria bacterium]MDE0469537.1 hypothetical protein [Candidatus Poribacteria bacterium]
MPNKRYQELLFSSQKKLDISAEQIRKLIPTSGEIGTLIEEMFRSYLAEVLPEKIGISNGFVMDSEGGESRQMDIILYDKMNTPRIFTSTAAQVFPVESTFACGEIKTQLNARELKDSFEKCLSYKNLHRKAYFDQNDSDIKYFHKLFGEEKEHWESIFFTISVECMTGSGLLMEYQRIIEAESLPLHKRIDTIFSLYSTDGNNIIANCSEEGLDFLPNKNGQFRAISVEKSWALFINLLLRYMVNVPAEPINMIKYAGRSLSDYGIIN